MMNEVFVGRGARAVEERLAREVEAWRDAVRAEPARLSHPLVVVVPSGSLRDHVAALLVRRVGTLAGVSVQTHHTLALQVLERAGVAPPRGAEWVPVLVQQQARRTPGLEALGGLLDGYGAVSAAVSDLLDAGLDEATAPAVRDFFAQESRGGDGAWPRAAAVVEVALAVRQALRARGLGRLGDVVLRAREVLEADPGHLPAGRLVLHGYADATGIVTDFLRALLADRSSLVLLDRPPDPSDPSRPDLGVAFTRRFEARVAPLAASEATEAAEAPPPSLAFFRAPGSDAEVRAVARRVLAWREAGAAWETIGVVTRTPALYAPVLRVQFGRLGIPFSGFGLSGPRTPAGRRVAFLVDLLRQGERLPADRFVNALAGMELTRRDDLRLGLHALGVARLGELARLDASRALGAAGRLPLPVRRGLEGASADEEDVEGDGGDDAGGRSRSPRASRRALDGVTLELGVTRAAAVVRWLARGDEALPLGDRLDELRDGVEHGLGWRRGGEAGPLLHRLAELRRELPADAPLRLDELALVVERAFRSTHDALGGEGGGVQVLDVVEARARTFAHLFVLGMNRDQFPRVWSDDPLLPDAVRRPLQAILPELPVKERGHDEERFLFSQLVSSSPHVTLSWQVLGDDGKAKAPSPLVDRLLPPDASVELVPTLLAPEPPDAEGRFPERPAHEWALLSGLHGSREHVQALLALAVAEEGVGAGREARRRADARMRVGAELDAARGDDTLLGPYLGHVGALREDADLRRAELFVTGVEGIARCPWQAFLARMLRLERPPDALEALPDATPLVQGRLVHEVLERIVTEALGEDAHRKDFDAVEPTPVAWPAPDALRRWTVECARRLLLEEGIAVPGYAELLAERMAPHLEIVRQVDWSEGEVPVVGAEVEASVRVETSRGPRTVRFRADRVDRLADGLRFTDYKTGQAKHEGKKLHARDNFERATESGRFLQAAAYAGARPGAAGRFLFTKPEVEERSRVVGVGPGNEALQRAFAGAVDRVVAASELGTLVPRLLDASSGEEPTSCQYCEVALACVRGDSGARRRLAAWADQARPSEDPRAAALRAIWWMKEDGGA